MESKDAGNLLLFIFLIVFAIGFMFYIDYLGVINLDFSGIPIFGELQENIFGG